MNMNQIQYFIAVGQQSSVSKAARLLHVSQPAVSESIKSLEQELGVSLFHRVNQRVYLTNEGKYYLEKVSKIMGEFNSLTQEMMILGSNKKSLRLGIPPMIGTFLFPRIFTEFKIYSPDINLEISEGGSIGLLKELINEKIDLAIVATSPNQELNNQHLSYKKLSSTELMYCVPESHPLAEKKKVSIAALAHENLILFKEGYIQNQLITQSFHKSNIKLPIILQTNQLYTIITFIKQNIGTSFLFKEAAKLVEDIIPISLENKILVDLTLVWKSKRPIYRDVKSFFSFLSNYSM